MGFDRCLGDGGSAAQAAVLEGDPVARLREGEDDLLSMVRSMPTPLSATLMNRRPGWLRLRTEMEPAAGVELRRVLQEVPDDLLKPRAVADRPMPIGIERDLQHLPLRAQVGVADVERLVHDASQADGPRA